MSLTCLKSVFSVTEMCLFPFSLRNTSVCRDSSTASTEELGWPTWARGITLLVCAPLHSQGTAPGRRSCPSTCLRPNVVQHFSHIKYCVSTVFLYLIWSRWEKTPLVGADHFDFSVLSDRRRRCHVLLGHHNSHHSDTFHCQPHHDSLLCEQKEASIFTNSAAHIARQSLLIMLFYLAMLMKLNDQCNVN